MYFSKQNNLINLGQPGPKKFLKLSEIHKDLFDSESESDNEKESKNGSSSSDNDDQMETEDKNDDSAGEESEEDPDREQMSVALIRKLKGVCYFISFYPLLAFFLYFMI